MLELIVFSSLGAVVQEVAHWYELRKKFTDSRVRTLFRSWEYWLVTIAMIILTPVCCWVLLDGLEFDRRLQFFLGAALPLLLKKTVSAVSKFDVIRLGDSPLSDYFQLHSFGR